MTTDTRIIGLMLAILGMSTSAIKAQQPASACALLQAAEIQTLAGNDKVGPGKASTEAALDTRMCRYEWGTGANVVNGRVFLDISVMPIAKAFPGMNASTLRQGLLAKGGQPNSGVIPGVGDAAVYESNAPIRVEATALAKGNMLNVSFQSSTARDRKDAVIALLKAAAGRL